MAKGDSLGLITNRDQSGKYWCLAENGLNLTVNASANLNVQCKYQNTEFLVECTKAWKLHQYLSLVHLSGVMMKSL